MNPSHNGGGAQMENPDTRAELKLIAETFGGNKLRWVDGNWRLEGEHRDAIYSLVPDADVIFSVDSDEVWNEPLVELALSKHDISIEQGRRKWLVPFVHFYRSFNRAVVNDGQMPQRLVFPKASEAYYQKMGHSGLTNPMREYTGQRLNIAHFGYAVPVKYQQYKWSGIHGHQNELRPEFLERFARNEQTDMHPVNKHGFWNPQPVNPLDYMPAWMQEHPYWGLDVIE